MKQVSNDEPTSILGNTMSRNVLIDEPIPDSFIELLVDNLVLHQLSDLSSGDQRFEHMDGLVTYGHYVTDADMMDRMPKLRIISNFGVGVDHIDLEAAKSRGIPVGNTPNVLDGAVADMTFALLMAAARNIVIGDRYARGPEFIHYDPSLYLGSEIHGSTLGIVGMGNIGRAVARRARGFDMRILYHNRNRNLGAEDELCVSYRSLDEILSESDYIVLNIPLTPETHHLIGRAEFQRIKPTGILINMARGGVVDHDALLEALENKWIAAAALDVTEPEPLPRDHPLLQMENLVIAPHLGSATIQTRRAMAQLTVDNLMAGLAGEPLTRRIA